MADRVGRSEAKRVMSSRQRGDTGLSTERKKGKVEGTTASESIDDNIWVSGQDLEGAEPVQGLSEMIGAALEAGEEVEMTEVDGGTKRSDGIEEDNGEFSDSSIISDITASQTGEDLYSLEDINDYLDLTKGRTINGFYCCSACTLCKGIHIC